MSFRVALLSEIIAPYRIPVFNALARQRDIDLHVIFLAETDPTQRQWLVYKDEIKFSYQVLPSWRWRRNGSDTSGSILLNRGMSSALDRFRPDSILCGGYNHFAFWQALAWAKLHTIHFAAWIESTSRDRRTSSGAAHSVKRWFVRHCDSFAVPGQSSFEYVRSMGVPPQQIHTAPNAVDVERFATLALSARQNERNVRTELTLPPRYFLYTGRIIPGKGVFHLLAAYSQLSAELRSQVGLVFVGEGSAKAELMKQAANIAPGTLVFPGFAQRDQLASFYALAEVLVFPTLSDPWGLVVNEAMACGLPIIATDVAGCSTDLVKPGENGYVIPAGDVSKLAVAMQTFACDQQLSSRMGESSARLIEHFSPELCAEGLALASGVPSRVSR